jgi:hypothetical protein
MSVAGAFVRDEAQRFPEGPASSRSIDHDWTVALDRPLQ